MNITPAQIRRNDDLRDDSAFQYPIEVSIRRFLYRYHDAIRNKNGRLANFVAAFNNGITKAGWTEAFVWSVLSLFRKEHVDFMYAVSHRRGLSYIHKDCRCEYPQRVFKTYSWDGRR